MNIEPSDELKAIAKESQREQQDQNYIHNFAALQEELVALRAENAWLRRLAASLEVQVEDLVAEVSRLNP